MVVGHAPGRRHHPGRAGAVAERHPHRAQRRAGHGADRGRRRADESDDDSTATRTPRRRPRHDRAASTWPAGGPRRSAATRTWSGCASWCVPSRSRPSCPWSTRPSWSPRPASWPATRSSTAVAARAEVTAVDNGRRRGRPDRLRRRGARASPTSTWPSPTATPPAAAWAWGSAARAGWSTSSTSTPRRAGHPDHRHQVVPMNADRCVADDGLWFRVETRRRGQRRAPGRRAARPASCASASSASADLAIVAAELTSNLVKHADEGRLLVRPVRCGRAGRVELVAIDSGPGMADLPVSAARRALHRRHARHRPGRDRPAGQPVRRLLAARAGAPCWSRRSGPVRRPEPGTGPAGSARPMTGEQVCGDGYAVRVGRRPAPGAGLRRPGARPAGRRRHRGRGRPRSWPRRPGRRPRSCEHLHRGHLAHPRRRARGRRAGPAAGLLRYAGLGNIAADRWPDGERRRGLVSLPGIAGHQRRAGPRVRLPVRRPARRWCMHSRRGGRTGGTSATTRGWPAARRCWSPRPCCATPGSAATTPASWSRGRP